MSNLVPGDNPRTIRTTHARAAFLEALSETCNVTRSCKLAGIGRQSVYDWRNDDPEFAADWQKALGMGAEALEDEAVRRALEGTSRPIFQGGVLVGHVQEYSDTLMIFLLKGAKPKKYRDAPALEPPNPDGAPIPVSVTVDL